MTPRQKIYQRLKDEVISEITLRGFTVFEHNWEGEIKRGSPLKFFRREREDEGFDLFDVQFDKYGDLKFVINFGIAPAEGITTSWGVFVPADELTANDCRLFARTWPLKRWFRADTPKRLQKSIGKVQAAIPAIDEWFRGGPLPASCYQKPV
ncbi:MAG: DUF4304 domain-containing protein [Verrucomicrobiota bacterium]